MIELSTRVRSLNTKTKPLPTCMLSRHAASPKQTLDEMGETLQQPTAVVSSAHVGGLFHNKKGFRNSENGPRYILETLAAIAK